MEEHKAPEHLKKFFNNLVDFKEFVRQKYQQTKNPIIKEIFDKFDIAFKHVNEEKSK